MLCFQRHTYDEPPRRSSVMPSQRLLSLRSEHPPWLASCWMLKPMPAIASASDTHPRRAAHGLAATKTRKPYEPANQARITAVFKYMAGGACGERPLSTK